MAYVEPKSVESDPWRWVVLIGSFFTMLLNAAVSYNIGVLNVAILDKFNVGVETVSWIMAVYGSVFAITGPIASAVINASDCRTSVFLSGLLSCAGMVLSSLVTHPAWLFLTLSIVGFGQSLAQVGGSVGVAYYFPTRTVFASGIALSGNGFGSFIHPALLQVLLDAYNLPGAFLILGGVCLHSSVCGLLMRPTAFETKRHLEKTKNEKQSLYVSFKSVFDEHREILTDCNFLKYLLAVFSFALAYNTTLVFLPECLITSKGYTHMEAATIASFVGVGSLLSRALVGFAATEQKIGEKLIYIGINMVMFLLCIAADFLMDFNFGTYFVAFAYGLYASPCVILFFTLTFYVLGYQKGTSGYGIVLLVYGFASLLGPPIYAIMLQILGCTALFKATGLLFLTSAVISAGITQHKENEIEEEKEASSNHDGGVRISRPHSFISDMFGSRNFEIIVSSQGRVKEKGHEGCCLEGVCGNDDNEEMLVASSMEGKQRHADVDKIEDRREENMELKSLLELPVKHDHLLGV